MENNDKNTKKNFLIYSLSGMFFKGSSSNDEPETSLTESEISENLFGGSKLGSLSLLPEMMGLSEEDAEKMGFVEEVPTSLRYGTIIPSFPFIWTNLYIPISLCLSLHP